jgi:hypothetical protein
MKGFSPEWRALINYFVSGGSVSVKFNDDMGHYFQTREGLRQGDPLSPLLFIIMADMLAIMIERAKMDCQIEGVIPHLVDGVLSILKYADDTILSMEHDLEKARHLKLIWQFLISSQVLRLISIRVSCSVLVRPRMRQANMLTCSAVGKDNSQFGIWGF